MASTSGTVRDIRTGRAIGRTSSLTKTFVSHIQALLEAEQDFYIVCGRCRTLEQRQLLDNLRELGETGGFPVIMDRNMPSETMWIFEGDPSELGFAV